MALAQKLINELKASGLSYSEIGRRLSRDSSLISQIARGKKVGANLEAGLTAIKRGDKAAQPARRVTKSGEVAKVRRSARTEPAKPKLVKDKEGRIKFAPASTREKTFVDRLSKIANAGGKVSFKVTLADGTEETVFRKGGIQSQRAIYQVLNHPEGGFAWLAENLRYSASEGEDIQSVEITAIY